MLLSYYAGYKKSHREYNTRLDALTNQMEELRVQNETLEMNANLIEAVAANIRSELAQDFNRKLDDIRKNLTQHNDLLGRNVRNNQELKEVIKKANTELIDGINNLVKQVSRS